MHKHMNYFVKRMEQLGARQEGVNLVDWTHWVAWDTSQDIAWCEETRSMSAEKDPVALDVLISFNAFATMIQVFKRFPLLSPIKYLFAPVKKLSSLAEMDSNTRKSVLRRIERRGNTPHPDLFEYVLSADEKPPTSDAELLQLGSVSLQVMLGGFGPMADWYYFTLFLLVNAPECYRILTDEIRTGFENYDDINIQSTANLHYLVACLDETLRMISTNSTGLPRYSPGAVVDGHYIPSGVTVQSSIHTLGRSPKYFHDPMHFRPERYLPASHPFYDKAFANDNTKGLPEFSLGPRACIGRELGWAEARLFMSKVLWQFDVVKAPGETLDMEGMERDLLHFGFLTKPRFMVQFVPVQRNTVH
ncbi:putative isotrichodermin c-15 hydroxylase protein [Eutypa lata UCREL1]|uniref:Putative isotrichodermin c-15 hydroxylase protein n=1 Tax=Eutypa lata (strain UCR-EL1) TaxID=1287681 RepID=M7TLR5_EUTLA|nr:putative isotrichodermin c-15 hydroxylase protein [Eutypa lata UCREL1]